MNYDDYIHSVTVGFKAFCEEWNYSRDEREHLADMVAEALEFAAGGPEALFIARIHDPNDPRFQ